MVRHSVYRYSLAFLLVLLAASLPACGRLVITQACPADSNPCSCGGLCPVSESIFVTASNQVLHFSVDSATGALTLESIATAPDVLNHVLVPPDTIFVYAVDATASSIDGFSGPNLQTTPGSPYSGVDGQTSPAADASLLYVPGSGGASVFSIGAGGGLTVLNPMPLQAGSTPYAAAAIYIASHFVFVSNESAIPAEIDGYTANPQTGVLTPVPGSPFTPQPSSQPAGAITVAGINFVYVALPLANAVAGFALNSTTGALTPVPGSPFPTGLHPAALSSDGGGNYLYVANQQDNTVSGFTIGVDGALTAAPGSPFSVGSSPSGIAVQEFGHFVYVANSGDFTISAFTISSGTGSLPPIPGSPFTLNAHPTSVTFAPVP